MLFARLSLRALQGFKAAFYSCYRQEREHSPDRGSAKDRKHSAGLLDKIAPALSDSWESVSDSM